MSTHGGDGIPADQVTASDELRREPAVANPAVRRLVVHTELSRCCSKVECVTPRCVHPAMLVPSKQISLWNAKSY